MKDDFSPQKKKNANQEVESSENEEVVFLSEDGEGNEPTVEAKIKDLREKLRECQKESAEHLAGWQRTRADFANLTREIAAEKEKSLRFAEEKLIEDLLPILEGYDSATRKREIWEKAPPDWRMGIEYLFQKLLNILEERGLRRIRPGRELFNPAFHSAIQSIETEKQEEDGMVLEMISEGYTLHEKVLKPAHVKVGVHK